MTETNEKRFNIEADPPATLEERKLLLDLLAQYITPDHVIIMDDEARQGKYHPKPQKKKMQSGGRNPAR